jgi:hypothetical protein
MRTAKSLATIVLLILTLSPCSPQTRKRPAAKKSAVVEGKSLLRMDLIQLRPREMAPLKRNIFAPQMGANRPVDIVPQGGQQPASGAQEGDASAPSGEAASAPPVMTINLRYIGFIESSRRMIALVVFEGRTLAVLEGEVVSEGIRIGKITREQVEVILPDSSTRMFSLEGE